MDHVTTQLPYALVVATATTLGYLTVGFSHSGLFGFVVTAVVMIGAIFITKKRQ